MMSFTIGLDILQVKKLVLYMLLFIIMQESKLIHMKKTLPLHNVIILIKSVFNKNKNHYYYEKFRINYLKISIISKFVSKL